MAGLSRWWSIWCAGFIVLLRYHYRHFDMCCCNIFIVFTVCILFIFHNLITWLMLLILYACTNNYHKTTIRAGLLKSSRAKKVPAPRINIKSHLSCREGLPEGSPCWYLKFQEMKTNVWRNGLSGILSISGLMKVFYRFRNLKLLLSFAGFCDIWSLHFFLTKIK